MNSTDAGNRKTVSLISILSWLILPCLILTSCAPSPEQRATQTATGMTATAAAWTPTPTLTPTLTPTNTTTPTLTATPTLTPTPTLVPTATPTLDPRRYYAPDKTYSLIPPKGWEEQESGEKYPALGDPWNHGIGILFYEESNPVPLAMFSAFVQDTVKEKEPNLTEISEEFASANSGETYFRWEYKDKVEGHVFHNVAYIYESGDWKLLVMYVRPNSMALSTDELVDQAMKTLLFFHLGNEHHENGYNYPVQTGG